MKITKDILKMIITESFVPFFLLLVILFGLLWKVDSIIEENENVIYISLESEENDPAEAASLTQKIQIAALSPANQLLVEKINLELDSGKFNSAVNLINKLPLLMRNNNEVKMTLGYCLYKSGKIKESISIFENIKSNDHKRAYYNLGLIYGFKTARYNLSIENFLNFLKLEPLSYEANLNLGYVYYKKKKYNEALEYFTKCESLSASKRKAKAMFQKARVLIQLGNKNEANLVLTAALKLDPDSVEIRSGLATLLMEKNPEKGAEAILKILTVYNEYAEGYYMLGKYFYEQEKYDLALKYLRMGYKQSPRSTLIKTYLGFVYLKLEEYDDSKQIYLELVSENSTKPMFYFNLARSYFGLNDFENALVYYQKAVQLEKDYYEALINIGIIYAKQEKYKSAIEYYNRAIKVKSDSPTVYYNLAVLYRKNRENEQALEAYKKALSIKENYPEIYYNKAIIFTEQGKLDEAEKSYLLAIKFDKKYTSAYNNISYVYVREKKIDEAIVLLKEGVRYTNDLKLITRLGDLYLLKNNNNKALLEYQKALKRDENYPDALLQAAKVELDLNKYEDSIKHIEKYIYLYPKHSEARYIYMVGLYEISQFQKAEKQYTILSRLAPEFPGSDQMYKKIKKKL